MKITLPLVCASILLLVTACHNYDVNGDSPVRYGKSVAVIPYDHIQRRPASEITIYDAYHPAPSGYLAIANLSRPGNPSDRMLIIGALEWRARMLGADGLILDGAQDFGDRSRTTFGNDHFAYSVITPGQYLFTGIAIITHPLKPDTTNLKP